MMQTYRQTSVAKSANLVPQWYLVDATENLKMMVMSGRGSQGK